MQPSSSPVYISGTATGVCCASPECGATSTSGSWRRGWPLEGDKFANLCNRCGQRWAKDKKAHQPPGNSAKAKQEDAPGGSKKRGAVAGAEGARGAAPSPLKRQKEHTPATMETRAAVPTPAAAAGRGPKPAAPIESRAAPPAQPQQQLGPVSAPASAPAAPCKPSPAVASFVSYTIQKLTSSKGNHALFWLQDAAGRHTLAVVGTDARLSGHFTYATSPDFTTGPPLRCTNRTEVTHWLAGFGVTEQVPEGRAGPLPELSAAERKRLLTGEPVWAKPQIDMRRWKEVREESGRLVDGRHFKRFFLLGEGGAEKVAVTGVDSHRKDRRYKYFAEEALGGFAFENSREVLDWLNFVLDRPANDPIQPQQARAAQALTEAQLGTAAVSKQPSLTVRIRPPPAPKAKVESTGRDEGAGRRERGGGSGSGGADPEIGDAEAGPGQDQGPGRSQFGGRSSSLPSLPAFGGKVRPMQQAPAPRFRCACCGMTDHDSDGCPLAALSPTTLIRRPTLDLNFHDPSLMGLGAGLAGRLAPAGTLPTPAGPSTPAVAADAADTAGPAWPLEFAAGERDVTPAVQATYQDYPCLRQWVTATPSDFTVETFKAWAERLGGHISDSPPQPSATPEEEPLGGWRWVPTAEALYILHELNSAQVSLALLESTEISRAVAMLRMHQNDAIARLAEGIVRKWRACAVAALHHATAALEQTK